MDRLVWLDLEMTGLDPRRHAILEVATLVTEGNLDVVAEGPDLVIRQPEHILGTMDSVVLTMHRDSGLLDRVRASETTLAVAEAATLAFVQEHVPEPQQAPLAGNSIHVDRRFLAAYMPGLDAYLHYRCVDVSAVKELARRWAPDVLASAPQKASQHRALADIHESLAELRHYREHFFRLPAPAPAPDEVTS